MSTTRAASTERVAPASYWSNLLRRVICVGTCSQAGMGRVIDSHVAGIAPPHEFQIATGPPGAAGSNTPSKSHLSITINDSSTTTYGIRFKFLYNPKGALDDSNKPLPLLLDKIDQVSAPKSLPKIFRKSTLEIHRFELNLSTYTITTPTSIGQDRM